MTWKNLFNEQESQEAIARINSLNPQTQAQWGKMNVAQMLAHCNVAYSSTYDENAPKAKGFKKLMMKLFVKNAVVGPKPYPKNSRTAPHFIIADERDFEAEKQRLITYVKKTQELGEAHFNGKESPSFGTLTKEQWNTLFSKHLDHHLNQFGA